MAPDNSIGLGWGPQCLRHAIGRAIRGGAARGPRRRSANELWRLSDGLACQHGSASRSASVELEHRLQESTVFAFGLTFEQWRQDLPLAWRGLRRAKGSWNGWWGNTPPFGHPVYVLTHHPRQPLAFDNGTTFTFVTDGCQSALGQARKAAWSWAPVRDACCRCQRMETWSPAISTR
jgi:hypothetical protein